MLGRKAWKEKDSSVKPPISFSGALLIALRGPTNTLLHLSPHNSAVALLYNYVADSIQIGIMNGGKTK